MLWRTNIAVNAVFSDVVDDKLRRLRAIVSVEHHRLVQVHVSLRDRSVFHNQLKVGVLVLGVSFA